MAPLIFPIKFLNKYLKAISEWEKSPSIKLKWLIFYIIYIDKKSPNAYEKWNKQEKPRVLLSAYDYIQQRSNKETHKLAEIAMNKYAFCRLPQRYLNSKQY